MRGLLTTETPRCPSTMGDQTSKDGCTCFPEAAQAGATHLVGVRSIPVGNNFCLPMTHQVHLEREQGQETSSESPCHH